MFKKRITRLIISIISYLLLIGTYWICPTIEMGNNIFKNIAILLVGQPILFILMTGFTLGLDYILCASCFCNCISSFRMDNGWR